VVPIMTSPILVLEPICSDGIRISHTTAGQGRDAGRRRRRGTGRSSAAHKCERSRSRAAEGEQQGTSMIFFWASDMSERLATARSAPMACETSTTSTRVSIARDILSSAFLRKPLPAMDSQRSREERREGFSPLTTAPRCCPLLPSLSSSAPASLLLSELFALRRDCKRSGILELCARIELHGMTCWAL
jgi:hypothetical protein